MAVLSIAPSAAKGGAVASPYFVSLPVDLFLIGGASIVVCLALPALQNGAPVAQIGLLLACAVSWPHVAATSHRLYGRREHLRQYPITAIAAPVIVLTGMLGSFAWPLLMAPYFIKLYLIWAPFHYSGQSFGISLLYARRANHRLEDLERFLLAAFIYGTFLTYAAENESHGPGATFYGSQLPSFGLPQWIATGFRAWTYACAALFLGLLLWRAIRGRRLPPFMLLLPAVTQYTWFMLGGTRRGSLELLPVFHGLQYLLIAWAMQVATRSLDQDGRQTEALTARFVTKESFRWYAGIVVLGVALFYGVPHLVVWLGAPALVATGVVVAAIQIHHYFVDGVIWKLKSRSVVSPLLLNIPALVKEEALVPTEEAAA